MGERYYVDPAQMKAVTRQLEELASLVRNATEEFLDGLAATISWPGFGTEFAVQAKQREQEERQNTKDTMMSIRDGMLSAIEATLKQIRLMESTRDRNLDEIERGTGRIESGGFGSNGTGGSGRDGQRSR